MPMDYEGFKKEIYRFTGIDLDCYKEKQMKRRLDSLIAKDNYGGYEQYVKAIKADAKVHNEFMNYITINVSEFYRNPEQWEKLKKSILPILLEKNNSLKIWSAACSSGDEPYTIAMILNEFQALRNVKIIATDIDKEILAKAKNGTYNGKSIENLPKEYIAKYFTNEGQSYTVSDTIKKCVEFKHHNLLSDPYPENCDMIVCRNVLIYFTEQAKVDIYMKFNKSLKTGGMLFVGSTEQIIMNNNYCFKPIQTFFYQKEKDI